MPDDAAEFLHGAGQEAGDVLEGDERNVERVAEAHEPRALHRRVDVERARQVRRLVRDDADRTAAEPREADQDVLREVRVHLEEVAIVHDRVDDVEHVVRLVRRGGDDGVERLVFAIGRIGRLDARRIVDVVAGHERQQLADQQHAVLVVSTAKCATPLFSLCVIAPPSSSFVTSSCVTVRITSGPVTNM